MPRIPTRQTTTVAPTVEPAGVPIPAGIFAAETQANRQAAQNLGVIGANMFKLQRTNEITNGQLEYEKRYSEFKLGLLEDTDYDSHNKKFKEFHARETANILNNTKNRGAKASLGNFFTDRQTNNGASVHIGAFRQQTRETLQLMPVKIAEYQQAIVAATTVDERMRLEEEMTLYLSGLQESGLFSEEVRDAQIKEAQDGIDEAVEAAAIESEFELARKIYDTTKDQTAALDVIRNSEIIPEDKKQEIQSDLVSEIGYRKAEEKRSLGQAQTKESESVYARLNSGDVSGINDFIDELPATTEKRKTELKKIAKDHAKAVLDDDLENSPINQFDPVTYQNLKFTVRNDPASVTNEQIAALVGKGRDGGITTGQYDEISNLHDKKLADLQKPESDAVKQPSVTRSHSTIGRLRTLEISQTKTEDVPAVEFRYQVIENNLDAFAEKLDINDPQFDEKIAKETQRLLADPVDEVRLGIFQKMMFPISEAERKRKGISPGIITTEEKLAKERMKALEKEEIFETMSETEKKQALRLFEAGRTVNDVVNLLLSNE